MNKEEAKKLSLEAKEMIDELLSKTGVTITSDSNNKPYVQVIYNEGGHTLYMTTPLRNTPF